MRQKLLLLFLVGLLTAAPAFADPADPTRKNNVSELGSTVHVDFGAESDAYVAIVANTVLSLTVDVSVRSEGSIIAYIYKLTLTNLSQADVAVNSFSLGPNLFIEPTASNLHSWGWVDPNPPAGSDPDPISGINSGFLLAFNLQGFVVGAGSSGMLTVYATAELLPKLNDNPPPTFNITEFFVETGTPNPTGLGATNNGPTLGPHLDGGGAGGFYNVPEASSLLLLTFGLLGGGVFRFRIANKFRDTGK